MSVIERLKGGIRRTPLVGRAARALYLRMQSQRAFHGSGDYWEQRYARGGHSGAGSYDRLAEFKAEVLNAFVAEREIGSVIEFGCGDGHQLSLANYPRYLGFDVSTTAIARCKRQFAQDKTKTFELLEQFQQQRASLVLSLDVIYHLVEDEVYVDHMRALFEASNAYVIVYATNRADDGKEASHVRHRQFTDWINEYAQGWQLLKYIPNRYPDRGDLALGSSADFYFFEKTEAGSLGQ
ncbi:MAG: methyltransferase domain-containing protein [Pseudomonadota bacterium]